jgi:hypothetical protein
MHPSDYEIAESDSVQDTGPTELVGGGVQLDESIEIEDDSQAPDDDGSFEDAEGMVAVVLVSGGWVWVCAN